MTTTLPESMTIHIGIKEAATWGTMKKHMEPNTQLSTDITTLHIEMTTGITNFSLVELFGAR